MGKFCFYCGSRCDNEYFEEITFTETTKPFCKYCHTTQKQNLCSTCENNNIKIQKYKNLLKEIEYINNSCPVCNGYYNVGHSNNCELKKLLKD